MGKQIVRVQMVSNHIGGYHEHIGAVELSTGERMSRDTVISFIRQGVQFYTAAKGYAAQVYVPHCRKCQAPYITTSRDGTTADNLDDLPRF
jgi:hypothetical protein